MAFDTTFRDVFPAVQPAGRQAAPVLARLRAAWIEARINRLERRFETGRMSEGAFEARQDALWRRLRALRAQVPQKV